MIGTPSTLLCICFVVILAFTRASLLAFTSNEEALQDRINQLEFEQAKRLIAENIWECVEEAREKMDKNRNKRDNDLLDLFSIKLDSLASKMDTKFDKMDDLFSIKLDSLASKMDTKFDKMDTKFDKMDTKFDFQLERINSLTKGINELHIKLDPIELSHNIRVKNFLVPIAGFIGMASTFVMQTAWTFIKDHKL
jgi:uncharacterized coiled-coil DUF342 family protein